MEENALKSIVYKLGLRVLQPLGWVGNSVGTQFSRPVFMIGSGRCGTTLLNRILKSHPDIAGFPDEANDLWHPKLYPFETAKIEIPPIEADPQKFTEVSINSWPPNHAQKIKHIFNGFQLLTGKRKAFFTKSAMVSHMVSKIVEIFPDAVFIHLYRYGPSVIESYVKKNFGKYKKYKYDIEEYYLMCAEYWKSCILEIEHMRIDVLSSEKNPMYEVSYEDLCADPEKTVKEIAELFGVEFAKFRFDLSTIKSTNYKVVNSSITPALRQEIDKIIFPAMKLKDYL